MVTTFHQLTHHLSTHPQRRTIAAAAATDDATIGALLRAVREGWARVTFVGGETAVRAHADFEKDCAPHCHFRSTPDAETACAMAVEEVREGRAEVLMKGLVNTDVLLHAVLHKTQGILPAGKILTHVSCAELPFLQRLLVFSDAAVIPYPTLVQRRAQIEALCKVSSSLGLEQPRIALVHCTEQVNAKLFPFTEDYLQLKAEALNGDFGNCLVDGPLDVKTSVNAEALAHKGIVSPLEGRADALLFPDIEAGNVFYKTVTLLPDVRMACMLVGAAAPVVLTSRSDSPDSKYCSLALAVASARQFSETQFS